MTSNSWHAAGLCRQVDPDLFFPEKGNAQAVKQICDGCPVRQECLDEAMEQERGAGHSRRHGVRGGLSPLERLALDRQRRAAA